MELKIENFGLIKEANIKLNGGTILCGVNSMGKSTVGKIVFSLIKAMYKYEEELGENKFTKIKPLVDELYYESRKYYGRINNSYFPPDIFRYLEKLNDNNDWEEYFNTLKKNISNDGFKNKAEKILNQIIKEITHEEQKSDKIKNALRKIFYSEFSNEGIKNKNCKICFKDNKSVFDIFFNDNNFETKIENEKDFGLIDATLIDTPMILNFSKVIEFSQSIFEIDSKNPERILKILNRPDIMHHYKDLISKLTIDAPIENDYSREIQNITGYKLVYDSKKHNFLIESKKSEDKFNIINAASGIRAFGILERLLSLGIINENNLVIIDEPESHLHPEWQLKYVNLITKLIDKNIKFLISTHSPYIIEAFQVYGEENKIKNKLDFYYAEENKNNVLFKNVTKNIEKIYEKFAAPYKELEFLKIDND
ncbi:MAG: AAA family ATPase [Candidatus Muiribacteriota bacterium]